MILLVTTSLALAIALARGGTFSGLASTRLRYGWLAILLFALQALVIYFPQPARGGVWSPQTLLLVGSHLLVLLVVGLNWRLPGMPLIGIGLALNLLVMVANGGYMPITPEALQRAGLGHLALGDASGSRLTATKDILLAREETRLWVLSDIVVIPATLPLSSVFSVGDAVLAAGVWWFFQSTMVPRRAPAGPDGLAATGRGTTISENT